MAQLNEQSLCRCSEALAGPGVTLPGDSPRLPTAFFRSLFCAPSPLLLRASAAYLQVASWISVVNEKGWVRVAGAFNSAHKNGI